MITNSANPALEHALETVKVTVVADPADCGNLFNPVGTRVFTSSCDIARALLAQSAVKYGMEAAPAAQPAKVMVGSTEVASYSAAGKTPADSKAAAADLKTKMAAALTTAGYPTAKDPGIVKVSSPIDIFRPQVLKIIGLIVILVIYVTMVYGPIAAALVELFPTRIRYTSMSLPYHIGNGWFGGLLPATAFALVAQTGDIYFGLWYPIIFALITFVVGLLFIPETKDRDIHANA
jgi:hypothetical protein